MPSLYVYDSTLPGWRLRSGRPSVVSADPGAFVDVVGMWVMRWVLISEVNGPEYSKEWVRIMDFTQPTGYVSNPSMYWDGEEANGGPYAVRVDWSPGAGYPVEVLIEWYNPATLSWSVVFSGVETAASGGGILTGYQFYDGDEVRSQVRLVAHDDASLGGPWTYMGPYLMTW